MIVYTDYNGSKLDVLLKARELIEKIAFKFQLDINEKSAITYLLDVLSTNMLDDFEHEKYMEEAVMLINPVERYCINKGREEGKKDIIRKMLDAGYSIESIIEISGLSKEAILKLK